MFSILSVDWLLGFVTSAIISIPVQDSFKMSLEILS